MSLAILHCRAQNGAQAPAVTIEVLLSGGLPAFTIVGMAETAVRESKDRVRGALIASGFEFPQQRITVSLGPAELRKSGGRYDLAIAVGILVAHRQVPAAAAADVELYGELALNGALRPVPGLLPALLQARETKREIIVPVGNEHEAALASVPARAATDLQGVAAYLAGRASLPPVVARDVPPEVLDAPAVDLADVRGQAQARRALEIAAAGGHNLLLIGPPGTGKSMLARRLPGILPPLSHDEALEAAAMRSVCGEVVMPGDWRRRPFRAPHHTATAVALVGGGSQPAPGEVSLAHHGVLFLDELPEFNRHVLEVLREPLETGTIAVARAAGRAEFPAAFQLVAAMNPCPCGYLGEPRGDCRCSAERVSAYRNRISGPLFDRIDLHVTVGRPPPGALRPGLPDGDTSTVVAARVAGAQSRQRDRAGVLNARLAGGAFERDCHLGSDSWSLLEGAVERFRLSARSQQRIRRVARTIADLGGAETITPRHLAEALSLRCLDRRP